MFWPVEANGGAGALAFQHGWAGVDFRHSCLRYFLRLISAPTYFTFVAKKTAARASGSCAMRSPARAASLLLRSSRRYQDAGPSTAENRRGQAPIAAIPAWS